MLTFPIEFFDDEIRDGFYVPPIMKHCWAAQMEVLNTVDEICKKNNIKYYIFSGTLMGAIRHGGFIPWDDDMDICMFRKDYMRFVKAVMRDKPEKYHVRNCHTDKTYRDVFTRLQNDDDVAMHPDFWKKGHGFVCNAGIDIFPVDYIPADKEKREKISHDVLQLCFIIVEYDKVGLTTDLDLEIKIVESKHHVKITRDDTIPQQMYLLMEDLLMGVKRSESKAVHISLDWIQNENWPGIPIECFKESIDIPFETATYKAPYLYDGVLRAMYGNYMKPVRVCDIHNFPWYQPVLDEVKKITLLGDYPYKEELLPESNRHEKWENKLVAELNETVELFSKASALAEQSFNNGDTETGNMLLEKCNSMAVNAEDIERRLKGNGRERVVFFTWKAEYWDKFEPYYFKEISEGNEVYVIPVPFNRLTETREQTEEYVVTEGFPEYVELTDFNGFDFDEVRISRIYIQNPYDNINGATSLRPFFYSDSIREYTDELIYVPWFELDEYGEEDERALYMMQFFVEVPGIVAADRILIPKSQEWIRPFYIKKLVAWAGKDTEDIWESKIEIVDTEAMINESVDMVEDDALKDSEASRKVLLYYVGLSQTFENTDKAIDKIERNLEVFESSKEVAIKLYVENGFKDKIKEFRPDYYKRLCEILDRYEQADNCEYIEAADSAFNNTEIIQRLANDSTAFYGDASAFMHMFSRLHKPVMIQNINI